MFDELKREGKSETKMNAGMAYLEYHFFSNIFLLFLVWNSKV